MPFAWTHSFLFWLFSGFVSHVFRLSPTTILCDHLPIFSSKEKSTALFFPPFLLSFGTKSGHSKRSLDSEIQG